MWTALELLKKLTHCVLKVLKGHSTHFIYQDELTCHVEYYTARRNSCIMSSKALEELFQVWENNCDDAIYQTSGALTRRSSSIMGNVGSNLGICTKDWKSGYLGLCGYNFDHLGFLRGFLCMLLVIGYIDHSFKSLKSPNIMKLNWWSTPLSG